MVKKSCLCSGVDSSKKSRDFSPPTKAHCPCYKARQRDDEEVRMRRTSPALSPSSDSSLVSLDSAASAMTSRPPTPVAKAITTSTDEVKQQTTTFYASPLPQHRSLMDVSGRCSPQPPRYSSRPHSPPTSSPSVEPKVNGSGATDGRANGYDYQSPSSREGEHELRREQSPLPRIVSTDSATPSATVGFL